MDYQTPGVYIREIDSGPKPITSVATSIPGFLGLFNFAPKPDAIAISGSDGLKQVTGKLTPQLVDKSGNFKGDANEGATQLTESLGFKRGNVKNVIQTPMKRLFYVVKLAIHRSLKQQMYICHL